MIHVSNNYISSSVHRSLIFRLAEDERQFVFVPIRTERDRNINFLNHENVKITYLAYPDFIKYLPVFKVLFISIIVFLAIRKIENGGEVLKARPILGHNFWSDGVPAFFCAFYLKSKFCLVVRNTDINRFIPKLKYARPLMKLIIKKSSRLVFVSEAHRARLREHWPRLYNAARRVQVIPNGVEDSWIDHVRKVGSGYGEERPMSVAYLGKFNQNKNLKNLYLALSEINARFFCKLILVGGNEGELKDLCGISGSIPDWLEVKQWMGDQAEVAALLSNVRVFAMPSFRETFGLVFIEALCCGCSIVHSKGEGIDGFFNEKFVRGVDPSSVREIESAIDDLLHQFPSGVGTGDVRRVTSRFDWSKVANDYREALS